MEELKENIVEYMEKKGVSLSVVSQKVSVSEELLQDIIDGKATLEPKEINRINEIIKISKDVNKKIVRILDLIFRLCAFIMPLVVIILSVYGFKNLKIMITLLSIGVACLAMTTLPKIEK